MIWELEFSLGLFSWFLKMVMVFNNIGCACYYSNLMVLELGSGVIINKNMLNLKEVCRRNEV